MTHKWKHRLPDTSERNDDMKFLKLNLQFFAEGGGGAEGTAADSSALGNIGETEAVAKTTRKGKGNPLQDVVYGKQEETEFTADSTQDEDSKPSRIPFEELIKGEYKKDFEERTQNIINKRFKETKGLQEQLRSHDTILNLLSDKYGIDAKDLASLTKAIENDESFYENEAMEKGLTVSQLKEIKALERQNREYKEIEESRIRRENSERIYNGWLEEAEQLKAKYGLENFSLEEEAQNEDFVKLLSNGISLESAYKAMHMDDMIGGAMVKTATTIKEKMSNSIQSRQSRPSENGINNTSSNNFKSDVKSLTKADRDEIERRVMRGANISF